EGFVSAVIDLNEHGKVVRRRFLDAGGKPVRHRELGYASAENRYDATGRLWMGASYFDEAGRPVRTHVVIRQGFSDGQGARVGLRVGDVLLTYGGEKISDILGAGAAVDRWAGAKGRKVPMQVRRGGKEMTFS